MYSDDNMRWLMYTLEECVRERVSSLSIQLVESFGRQLFKIFFLWAVFELLECMTILWRIWPDWDQSLPNTEGFLLGQRQTKKGLRHRLVIKKYSDDWSWQLRINLKRGQIIWCMIYLYLPYLTVHFWLMYFAKRWKLKAVEAAEGRRAHNKGWNWV